MLAPRSVLAIARTCCTSAGSTTGRERGSCSTGSPRTRNGDRDRSRSVSAGQVVHPLPRHRDVVVPGLIDEAVKWGLLRGAVALVNPSTNESFSFIVLESWVAGVPVVVNGRCAVTREHCERSGGGLWFESYAEFEAVVDRLVADDELRSALAARGAAYVERFYRWAAIAERYEAFVERAVERASSAYA